MGEGTHAGAARPVQPSARGILKAFKDGVG